MGSKYHGLRMAIGAACFVGGFFFWPLFILAAFIGWSLRETAEERHEASRPKPKAAPIERIGIKAEDRDWKARYLAACESPAESAFLTAMIGSFSLQPHNGVLKGPGLTLNMQVEMKPYRLDFLANGWLVIEIDGATWHSSPEAMARDKIRDDFFQSYDYTVLRIPAKVVFSMPHEAVAKVRASLAEGRKISVKPEVPKPISARAAAGKFIWGAGQLVEDLNAHIDRAAAIQNAMSKPELIYHAEKQAISFAMNHVDRMIEQEKRFSERPELRADFEQNHARLEAILNNKRDPTEELCQIFQQSIVPFQEPQPHPKREINEAIRERYAALMEERAAYFEEVRQKLKTDITRQKMVQNQLLKMGCASCWASIMPPASTT